MNQGEPLPLQRAAGILPAGLTLNRFFGVVWNPRRTSSGKMPAAR